MTLLLASRSESNLFSTINDVTRVKEVKDFVMTDLDTLYIKTLQGSWSQSNQSLLSDSDC